MSRVIVEQLNNNQPVTLSVKKNEDITFVLYGLVAGKKNITVELKDEGARAQILGLFVGHEGQMEIKTTQHHLAPNTTSDLLFKTVLFKDSKFDYQGLIKIDQKAQNSNAYQRNDNLVIGTKAKVDTKPELEILANEVRCTHGATVGKLDEEQIYYLMSRGLSRTQTVEVLLEGFLGEVIERIEDKEKREEIKNKVFEKFNK